MERRKFLIGAGSTAIGASAVIGSGAFSRIESQRQMSIAVATDEEAYLRLAALDTRNSENYVGLDEKGHLEINIADQSGRGEGVNSDSFTWFDGMFEICNNGKDDAVISYELPDTPAGCGIGDNWESPHEDYDEQVVGFYYIADEDDNDPEGTRVFVEEGKPVPLELGDCVEMGVRTVTKGINAEDCDALIDGEVVLTADASGAGEMKSDY